MIIRVWRGKTSMPKAKGLRRRSVHVRVVLGLNGSDRVRGPSRRLILEPYVPHRTTTRWATDLCSCSRCPRQTPCSPAKTGGERGKPPPMLTGASFAASSKRLSDRGLLLPVGSSYRTRFSSLPDPPSYTPRSPGTANGSSRGRRIRKCRPGKQPHHHFHQDRGLP